MKNLKTNRVIYPDKGCFNCRNLLKYVQDWGSTSSTDLLCGKVVDYTQDEINELQSNFHNDFDKYYDDIYNFEQKTIYNKELEKINKYDICDNYEDSDDYTIKNIVRGK